MVIRTNLVKKEPESWPITSQPVSSFLEDHAQVAGIANNSMVLESRFDWSKYSRFSKCIRVIAFCLRIKYKSQSKVLLTDELQRAETSLLRMIQKETLLEMFKESRQNPENSKKVGDLSKFSPFFDDKGLIRIRGRIKHANLTFEQRHPILHSTKHEMVGVMLRDLHHENNHEGVEYVRSVIQQKFWFVGLRNALRRTKNNCVFLSQNTCRDQSATYG